MQYRYVVVDLADGGSWHLYGDESRPEVTGYSADELRVLPDLLADGWVPIRETPCGSSAVGAMRGGVRAFCLVLLSKE
ncbi:hypothetical protein [Rubripirellula tenax]|uniref:hypothetical protein n=1 Tax=Rubripirellula tenax TaxID=2528015 RepID=UPI00164585D8|nr:hypothetical protein [Rubripirellula tenax]